MDIDKLIRNSLETFVAECFGSLMDIDKLILESNMEINVAVLVL